MAPFGLRGARWSAALVAMLAAGLSACQWLVTLRADGPVADASVDAGPLDPCGPLLPRPAAAGGPDLPSSIVLASYIWGYESKGRPDLCERSAFDLDGLDTAPPDCTAVACKPRGAVSSSPARCDLPGGVDNALVTLYQSLAAGGPGTAGGFDANLALDRGVVNLLLEIEGWDGQPDDSDVSVKYWVSSGIGGLPQPKQIQFEDLSAMPSRWDGGQDVSWVIDERAVRRQGEAVEPRLIAKGWVTGGILVVPNTGPLTLPGLIGGGALELRDGVFMGRLENKDGHWSMSHGRIGASIESAALLIAAGASRFSEGTQLCEPNPSNEFLRPTVREAICTALDLPADGGAFNKEIPCGAISIGFMFASVEGRIAYVDAGPDHPRVPLTAPSQLQGSLPCADAGTIWCDDCDWQRPARCPAPPD